MENEQWTNEMKKVEHAHLYQQEGQLEILAEEQSVEGQGTNPEIRKIYLIYSFNKLTKIVSLNV